jgi:hypothetical protein
MVQSSRSASLNPQIPAQKQKYQANLNPQMTVPKESSKQQSKRNWRIKTQPILIR